MQITTDLEAYSLRACAIVAMGAGPYLLEVLRENRAESRDPSVQAEIAAKIDVVERWMDKRER